jgi:hypothetical protein
MRRQGSEWIALFLATVVVAIFTTRSAQAELLEKAKKVGDTTVRYKIVLPNGYDPAKTYPAVLAFGGGPQTMNTVDNVLNRNFRAEAEKRGYIVVAPAAPNDQLFFEDGARIFPEFLKMILADYRILDNKFHIAGRPMVELPPSTSRRRILSIFYPLRPSLDICGSPARPNFRLFRRCASSCMSARMTSTCGTRR